MDRYDYIITGAGAAGLSLLVHIIRSGKFANKKILLVDREAKQKNDRTWCFWEKEAGLFEDVVLKKYRHLWFHDSEGSALHDISPYEYKLIRGIDFYNYCFNEISGHSNIEVRYGSVERCDPAGSFVVIDGVKVFGKYIFNSILFKDIPLSEGRHFLLQHFRGWVIEAREPVFDPQRATLIEPAFDPQQATLMDFRVAQAGCDTTFVYVMPFSETRALVEFTVFSAAVLGEEEYDKALKDYCVRYLALKEYDIVESESGSIPMTDHKFLRREKNIINIGTAGGRTKPSSGYTFHFIQEHSRRIVEALITTGRPFISESILESRFDLYDRVLLDVLSKHSFPGERIFSILMRSNEMKAVLKFLDNDTSLFEELKIIRKLPKRIFLKAALGI